MVDDNTRQNIEEIVKQGYKVSLSEALALEAYLNEGNRSSRKDVLLCIRDAGIIDGNPTDAEILSALDNADHPLEVQEWTKNQFLTSTEPYEALALAKKTLDNFGYLQREAQTVERAKRAGVSESKFRKMYEAYLTAEAKRTEPENARHTHFAGQPIELDCGEYRCDDMGVGYAERVGNTVIEQTLLPTGLTITRRLVDITDGTERVELAYQTGDAWRKLIVPRSTVANAQRVISLADSGVSVDSERASKVVKYLNTLLDRNMNGDTAIPVERSTDQMGWIDGNTAFVPFTDGVTYSGENDGSEQSYRALTQHGDRDAWMDEILSIRNSGHIQTRILLDAAFAAPLLPVVGCLPFFVNAWGESSTGKTVAMHMAASVWGDPVRTKKTFASTVNAMESLAGFYKNLPVIFDEMQVDSGASKKIDEVIYMLCNGESKQRQKRAGGLRKAHRWQTVFILNGEMPLVKSNSGAGAAVRTVSVYVDGMLFDDPAKSVNVFNENYGFAGREFVRALLTDPKAMVMAKELFEAYRRELHGKVQDKQVMAAAAMLTAGAMAELIVFHDGRALKPQDYIHFLMTRDESDMQRRAYSYLCDIISANLARFDDSDENRGEIWGMIDDKESIAYIIPTKLGDLLQREGYSGEALLNWLDKKNLLVRESYESRSGKTCRKMIGGLRTRVYGIRLPDAEKTDSAGLIPVDKPDDLPF